MTESLLTEGVSKTYLPELVGDDKKFKDVESLARGKYEADVHINILEKRLDDLRADYLKMHEESQARAKLEDLIAELDTKQSTSTTPSAIREPVQPKQPEVDIDLLVANKIQAYETTKKSDENFNTVRNKLTERFGDSYPNLIKEKITELGLSAQDADNLARKSPTAFFNTLGIDLSKPKTFQAPPQSSNTNMRTMTPQVKRYSYYQELKKTNPKLYLDPKIANEMHDQAIEQGDAFFDVD